MKVIYRPDGGTEQVWDYKPDDLPYAEAEAVEDVLDVTFDEFRQKVARGGAKARRALLWVLLRRDSPRLRFSDVQLRRAGELIVEWDSAEIARIREATLNDDDMPEEDREELLRLLDDAEPEVASPKEAPPEPGGDLPEDTSNASA